MCYVLSLAWPLELIQPLPLLAYAYAYTVGPMGILGWFLNP